VKKKRRDERIHFPLPYTSPAFLTPPSPSLLTVPDSALDDKEERQRGQEPRDSIMDE